MAISGTFLADFASFDAACQKSEVSLRGFETGAGKVETALNKMVDSFSGRKIIQDATLAAEAVERIGGATKLTEAEQAKINRTLGEALAKYQALGQEAPAALTKLHADTTRVDTATKAAGASATDWKGVLLGAAGAVGLAFSIQGITRFIGSTIESASHVKDLSDKLGVSTDAVQRWEHAASLSGATIETVDRAVSFMNRTLSAGGDGTVEILAKLGLRFDEIRAMRPEDAFNAIAAAVATTPDPMLKAEAATKLFSKSGQELLPALANGFTETARGASVMSEETITRLEAAGDAWTKVGHTVTIVTGEMIGKILQTGSQMSDLVERLAGKVMGLSDAEIDGGMAARKWAESHASAAVSAAAVEGAATKVTAALKATEAAAAAAEAAQKKADAEATARATAMIALQDRLFGRDLTAKAAEYATALGGVDNVSKLIPASQAEMNKVMTEALAVLTKSGQAASGAAIEYGKLKLATTDFAAIGASLWKDNEAAFTRMNTARQQGTQATLAGQMAENAGLTDNTLAYGFYSQTAEQANAEVAKAQAEADKALKQTKGHVEATAAAYSVMGSAAMTAASAAAQALQLNTDAEINIKRGGLSAQYGILQRENATRLTNGLPSFASGGFGDFGSGTAVMLHGKESIVPWGAGGASGGTTTINAPITINVPPGGDATRAGREAADALLARLKSRGVRI